MILTKTCHEILKECKKCAIIFTPNENYPFQVIILNKKLTVPKILYCYGIIQDIWVGTSVAMTIRNKMK